MLSMKLKAWLINNSNHGFQKTNIEIAVVSSSLYVSFWPQEAGGEDWLHQPQQQLILDPPGWLPQRPRQGSWIKQLKGTVPRDFRLQVFSWISFPQQICTSTCKYLREFSIKFEMILMLLSEAWGKMIHEKNQKQKISWHCPFKGTVRPD